MNKAAVMPREDLELDDAHFDDDFDDDFDAALDEEFEQELAVRFADDDMIQHLKGA